MHRAMSSLETADLPISLYSLTPLKCKLMMSFLVCIHSFLVLTLLSACVSERAAAMALGFTQVSWDNDSGEEQQPLTGFLSWAILTDEEKAAASVLGYTATNWNDLSWSAAQPTVVDKSWAELTSCADGEDASTHVFLPF